MQDDRLEGESLSLPDTGALQTPKFAFPGFPVLPDKLRGSLGTTICFHKTRSRMELKVFFLVLFPGAKFDIFFFFFFYKAGPLCVEFSRQAPGEPGKLSRQQARRQEASLHDLCQSYIWRNRKGNQTLDINSLLRILVLVPSTRYPMIWPIQTALQTVLPRSMSTSWLSLFSLPVTLSSGQAPLLRCCLHGQQEAIALSSWTPKHFISLVCFFQSDLC